jgi:CrcB protein
MKLMLVFTGGGLGCVARWAIGLLVQAFGITGLPVATFISNAISCGIMAIMLRFFEPTAFNTELRLLVFTGFCGGLSTFSTFSLENIELLKNGNYAWVAGNVLLSLLMCFGILYWGLRR